VETVRALALVVLVGCAVDERAEPDPALGPMVTSYDLQTSAIEQQTPPDLCALAAALPTEDLCSLACDPGALAERAASEGMPAGRCYQFRCELSAEITISVGVCL
jgi:hypothetical protein